jgi:hypothetical protein
MLNDEQAVPIQWAPRVKQSAIRRLYEQDAAGLLDEALLDEVGWALSARCDSFIAAVDAVAGRARCAKCSVIILHSAQPDEILHCANCSWRVTWRDYFATIQHRQLSGAEPILKVFRAFILDFPLARTPQAKMLLIDGLIHAFHVHLVYGETRAAGVNLIGGRYHEVVDFLDNLSYGPSSTPGLQATRKTWRQTINRTAEMWNDPTLRRSGLDCE